MDANTLRKELNAAIMQSSTGSNPCLDCENQALHFHGSDVGACRRKVWYKLNEDKPPAISNELAAFFFDGHFHEKSIVKMLGMRGFSVECDREVIIKTTISIDLFSQYLQGSDLSLANRTKLMILAKLKNDIFIYGHTDGILTDKDGKKYLIECKAVKDYSFKQYLNGKISDVYMGQVQGYLQGLNLDEGFLIVKNRTTSEIVVLSIKRDERYFIKRCCELLVAELNYMVVDGKDSVGRPFRNNDGYECKYCDYKKQCWG